MSWAPGLSAVGVTMCSRRRGLGHSSRPVTPSSTIRFGLTGQVTPIPTPALGDLFGRVPGAPPEIATTAPSPRRPVAGRELHATRGATDGATGGGHRVSGMGIRGGSRSAAHAQVGAAAAKLKIASAGVMEREDICVRFIRTSASVPDGRPRPRVATCAAAGAHPDCERTG